MDLHNGLDIDSGQIVYKKLCLSAVVLKSARSARSAGRQ